MNFAKTKTLILAFICFVFTNCKESRSNETQIDIEKPIQYIVSFKNVDNKLIETNIDTLSNLNGFLNILDKNNCINIYQLLNHEIKDKTYNLKPMSNCYGTFHYRLKEIIYVSTDSIAVNRELRFPIDSLNIILRKHLLNHKQDKNYPFDGEQKLISVHVDTLKPIAKTKELIKNIINDIIEIDAKPYPQFIFNDGGIIPKRPRNY